MTSPPGKDSQPGPSPSQRPQPAVPGDGLGGNMTVIPGPHPLSPNAAYDRGEYDR